MKGKLILLALVVSACSHVNPITMVRMMALNPMTADPGDIAAYYELPDGYQVTRNTATFSISGHRDKGGPEFLEEFVLVPTRHGDLLGYELSAADRTRLLNLQEQVRVWKADPTLDSGGSMFVGAKFCKTSDKVPDGGLVSMYIRLSADGSPMPLVRNVPIQDHVDPELLGSVPLCE
ncbi:MAG: hypothetical protein ACPGRD_05410 [Planktomarina sp.]